MHPRHPPPPSLARNNAALPSVTPPDASSLEERASPPPPIRTTPCFVVDHFAWVLFHCTPSGEAVVIDIDTDRARDRPAWNPSSTAAEQRSFGRPKSLQCQATVRRGSLVEGHRSSHGNDHNQCPGRKQELATCNRFSYPKRRLLVQLSRLSSRAESPTRACVMSGSIKVGFVP